MLAPNMYDGKPCKYGHGTLRYKSSFGCVKCTSVTRNRLRLADMPKNRKQDRDRKRVAHRRDPRAKMLKTAQHRAKEKGLPCTIALEDIVIPEYCPLLNVPLKVNDGKLGPNSPSLDRILNEYGYVRGNVHVVSHRANWLKGNVTSAELMMAAFRLTDLEKEARLKCGGQ